MSEWIDVDDEPPRGKCFVFLESNVGGIKHHGANFDATVPTIGGRFFFDMPKVISWMPMIEPPSNKT